METDRELSRKLVRSTIAQYEQARAAEDFEVMSAMRGVSRTLQAHPTSAYIGRWARIEIR
jgi:hypothetical protein